MRKLVTGLMIGSALASPAAAGQLTPAEVKVCANADQCADILLRHRPSQFDYDVLAREFERLSPTATRKLVGAAKAEQLANLERLAERVRPEIALEMGLLLQTRQDEAARTLGRHILRAQRLQNAKTVKLGRPVALPLLLELSADAPGPLVARLLGQHEFEAARPGYIAMLRSRDAVTPAYNALFADNPETALQALVAQMRRTQTLPEALAIGRMIAGRDTGRADGFYARMLDDIANDPGYPMAMRDGMRAGSLSLARSGAPLSYSTDLAEQLIRLDAADALDLSQAFARSDAAVRAAYLDAARRSPGVLETLIPIVATVQMQPGERAEWTALALQSSRAPIVQTALSMVSMSDVDRWEPRLRTLARSHPFDSVRAVAAAKLDRNPVEPDIRALRSRAGEQNYCVDGERVSALPDYALLPTFEEEQTGLDAELSVSRQHLQTSYPARERWLAGYARHGASAGSLIAFDYAQARASVISDAPVRYLIPDSVPEIGQQPQRLWVIGMSTVESLAPDGANQTTFVASLPGPVRDVFRLSDDSLLLHFHDARVSFQPKLVGDNIMPGWVDAHPPLRLLPSGALQRGCVAEALAGGRPDATP